MNRLLTALFLCALLRAFVDALLTQTDPDPGGTDG